MKKVLFLLTLAACITVHDAYSKMQRDPFFKNLYYNDESFPEGVLSDTGKPLISPRLFHTSLFAWDLNGVVLDNDQSYSNGIKRLVADKTAELGGGWWAYAWACEYAAETFTKTMLLLKWKNDLKSAGDRRGYVWEAMLDLQAETNPQLAQTLRKFTVKANHLNYNTVNLIMGLACKGNTNAVLSNMGAGILDDQITALRNELSSGTLTDEQTTAVNFTLRLLTQNRNVVASRENNWLCKPFPEAYQTFLDKNRFEDGKRHLKILVDDSKHKIVGALDNGFDIGIFFTNPQELQTILGAISGGELASACN